MIKIFKAVLIAITVFMIALAVMDLTWYTGVEMPLFCILSALLSTMLYTAIEIWEVQPHE